MKQIITLIFCSLAFLGFTQDYQTIKSTDINYFSEPDSSYILATKIDSFEVQGNDSIFYGFKTLRRNDTTSAISYCSHVLGAPWFGKKVIVKDNGTNLFFNQDNDTIRIETSAAMNDTFTVYNYGSGEWIKAVVESHDTMTVLGIQDSVKTLKLFSNHSGFAFNDSTLAIGKQLGFIRIVPFYSFPLIYDSNPDFIISNYPPAKIEYPMYLVGIEKQGLGIIRLKKADYFNQSIGDVIKNTLDRDEYSGATLSGYDYNKYEWHLQALDDYSPDSLVFDYQVLFDSYWYNSVPAPGYYGHTLDSFQYAFTVKKLDDYLTSYVPEEYYDSLSGTLFNDGTGIEYGFLSNLRCRNYMKISDCGDLVEGIIAEQGEKSEDGNGDSTCFGNLSVEPSSYNIYYQQNIGGPYTYISSVYTSYWKSFYGEVSYYDAGGKSCGTNWFVTNEEEKKTDLTVYPNPSTGIFHIQLSDYVEQFDLGIYNLQGESVYRQHQKVNTINLSHLPKGIYILQLSTDSGQMTKRIILQ